MELTKMQAGVVLSKWGLEPISYKKFKRGLVNDNWLVVTRQGKFVLRRFVKKKSQSDLLFEYRFLKYLERKKFPYKIPTPILARPRRLSVKLGNKTFCLYKYIEGSLKNKTSVRDAYLVGQMVASYNNIVESSNLDNGVRRTGGDEINSVFSELRKKREVAKGKKNPYDALFIDIEGRFENMLKQLTLRHYYKMKKYPLHYDITLANILWKNGQISGVIDFENLSHEKGALIMELAATLYCCIKGNVGWKTDFRLSNSLLKGYKSRRAISAEDCALLPGLLVINHASDLDFLYSKLQEKDRRIKPYYMKNTWRAADWIYKNRKRLRI
jgi:Ser/Thr protein kinase RdoA (MazF antagonist)